MYKNVTEPLAGGKGMLDQKRGRGRPVEFDRAKAVRQAMDVFWGQGFEMATARNLAAAMQIRPSSFYNSFGDRESVFREALGLYTAEAPDAVLGAVEPGMPVLPILWDMFRDLCRVRAADPRGRGCLVVNSLAELVRVDAVLGDEVAGAVREKIARIDRLLEQAEGQGEILPLADRNAVAEGLFAFLCGVNLIAKVIRQEEALWLMCKQVLIGLGLAPSDTSRPS
jgi:TetR/AcrR family transcriptional repressor of nem operon